MGAPPNAHLEEVEALTPLLSIHRGARLGDVRHQDISATHPRSGNTRALYVEVSRNEWVDWQNCHPSVLPQPP